MACGRRYFILDERRPISKSPDLLGRVVTNKVLPTKDFAPAASLQNGETRHGPEDILPKYRQRPRALHNTTKSPTGISDWTIAGVLACVFSSGKAPGSSHGVHPATEELKYY